MDKPEIDPVRYGVLWQKVQDYERRFDDMSAKIDKMETSIETLVALANQGRGGFWMGMVIVSAVSSLMGYVSHWIGKSQAMNAPFHLITDAGDGICCPGQVDLERAAATTTQASTKANGLRGAGVVRYWADNARPSRTPQGYAGVARQDKVQR